MSLAHAGVSVTIVNNTRFEFDVGAPLKPYVSNEVAMNLHNFGNILDFTLASINIVTFDFAVPFLL